ncbi:MULTISPECIES: zinc-binding dehydrogenase [unclassified Pseudofrankia]|uniref:zinc-binding dehydrogenase n=1 Tax=unclassified Pseudofrankia TaxID=2994372 RepID=UPI0008DAA8E1|nr:MULTISPECIES: zinc-binding dehydrogenase [unclassified Pseudofrankia]MDT3444942.1 zinc-binding dehydrogenase [Pseudofrankia sp. BMG5.37]OHV64845.1 alcohol dehydrogenase [Pseudofrankia sp. BMG5.36]
MQAWQYVGDHQPITLNEIDEPVAGPGEVLLEVKGAGICHTDVGHLEGTISHFLAFRPITLGHEVAGVVSQIGEGVTSFSVGDRVAVRSVVEGPGTGRDGGFQPRLAVQTDVLVPVPDGVPWDQAAVSTDAGMTSYHAVMARAGVKAGDKIGIIGFGGLGSLGTHIALRAGAQVFVAETKRSLHPKIIEAGAAAVSSTVEDFKGEGLDAIIDFAGFGTTTASAVETVKPGGRVVQVGLAERFGTLDLIALTMNQVDLLGSQGGTNEDNAKVLQLMAAGHLQSETERIAFDEIGEAIERLRRGENAGRLAVIYD